MSRGSLHFDCGEGEQSDDPFSEHRIAQSWILYTCKVRTDVKYLYFVQPRLWFVFLLCSCPILVDNFIPPYVQCKTALKEYRYPVPSGNFRREKSVPFRHEYSQAFAFFRFTTCVRLQDRLCNSYQPFSRSLTILMVYFFSVIPVLWKEMSDF